MLLATIFGDGAVYASSDNDMAVERDAAIAWTRENAVKLTSLTSGSGFDDLVPIASMIDGVTVIGLGEATHGTREFFQFKHRMLEYLVEEHGFRVFGIEANFADCLPINNFVLTGEGDPEALIHGMNFWTWDTEEVLDLVNWMRAYNLEHKEKIFFHGYDVQYAPSALKIVIDFLKSVDNPKAAYFNQQLEFYISNTSSYQDLSMIIFNESTDRKVERHDKAIELLAYMDDNETALIKAGGKAEYAVARAAAFNAERAFAMFRPEDGQEQVSSLASFDLRDRGMADMVLWGLDHYGRDLKAVLWAHNGHVQKAGFEWEGGKAQAMGMNLADDLGDKYISLGFGFGEGGLQARGVPNSSNIGDLMPLQAFIVGPAAANTLGGTMTEVGLGDFLIDLRRLKPGPAKDWYGTPQPMRLGGGTFADVPADQWGKVKLLDTFDLFVFVEKTSRARPLMRTRERFGLTDAR